MTNPEISIIIPVYNVEAYLKHCIDSILVQSFREYELLLIDDGSTDLSGQICDEYASADSRFRVFHQKNAGLSAARNTGLANVRGKYVTMVDSDDILLSPDYLKTLYDSASRNNADITVCGHVVFYDGDEIPDATLCCDSRRDKTDIAVLCGYDYCFRKNIPEGYLLYLSTGRLYRSDLFKNVRYPVGRMYEDVAVEHLLALYCQKIVFVNAAMYGYRVRRDSLHHGAPNDVILRDKTHALLDKIDYYNKEGFPELAHMAEQTLVRWTREELSKDKK